MAVVLGVYGSKVNRSKKLRKTIKNLDENIIALEKQRTDALTENYIIDMNMPEYKQVMEHSDRLKSEGKNAAFSDDELKIVVSVKDVF